MMGKWNLKTLTSADLYKFSFKDQTLKNAEYSINSISYIPSENCLTDKL